MEHVLEGVSPTQGSQTTYISLSIDYVVVVVVENTTLSSKNIMSVVLLNKCSILHRTTPIFMEKINFKGEDCLL